MSIIHGSERAVVIEDGLSEGLELITSDLPSAVPDMRVALPGKKPDGKPMGGKPDAKRGE